MTRPLRRRVKKVGTSPGTLVHTGEIKTERATITVINYDETHCDERTVGAVQECFPFRDTPRSPGSTWTDSMR